jgi:hypothetical protein
VQPFSCIAEDPVLFLRTGSLGSADTCCNIAQTPSQPLDDALGSLCVACWAFPPVKCLAVGDIVDALRAFQRNSCADEARTQTPLLYGTHFGLLFLLRLYGPFLTSSVCRTHGIFGTFSWLRSREGTMNSAANHLHPTRLRVLQLPLIVYCVVRNTSPRDQQIQSTSEHSPSDSQPSKPSRASALTARSPKHADLAS